MMKYVVVYERSKTGWGAYAPDLPGLGIVAATLEEASRLVREAIELHIEALREAGQPIPKPTARTDVVEVAAG